MEQPFASGEVHGVLHRPARPNGHGIVLTHGAGSNAHAPLLARLAHALENSHFTVLRYDLPFRRLRLNRTAETPEPAWRVVLEASLEVRSAVVFATAIVILVFLPLFAL